MRHAFRDGTQVPVETPGERRLRLERLRLSVRLGRYRAPAEEVARAFIRRAGSSLVSGILIEPASQQT